MLGNRGLVQAVLDDYQTAPIDEREKALFRFLEKMNAQSNRVTQNDVDVLKAAGWSEEAIYDALTVASVFKFYNTWNNGSGVRTMKSSDYLYSGKVLTTLGYCMDFKLTRLAKLTALSFSSVKAIFFSKKPKKSAPASVGWTGEPSAPAKLL